MTTAKAEKSSKSSGTKAKKRGPKVENAIVHINATLNNTRISFTNSRGDMICSATSGGAGFRGSKKSTPFAAQAAATALVTRAKECVLSVLEIRVKGIGPGRDTAIRTVAAYFRVMKIADCTGLAHGGCRAPKPKRN